MQYLKLFHVRQKFMQLVQQSDITFHVKYFGHEAGYLYSSNDLSLPYIRHICHTNKSNELQSGKVRPYNNHH